MPVELRSAPFLTILNGLLHSDASDEEVDRADKCCKWAFNHRSKLKEVLLEEEQQMLTLVLDSYEQTGKSLSEGSLYHIIHSVDKNDAQKKMHAEYLSRKAKLPLPTHLDCEVHLQDRIGDYNNARMHSLLAHCEVILTQGGKDILAPGKEKPTIKGPEAARDFFRRHCRVKPLIGQRPEVGGQVSQMWDGFAAEYEQKRQDALNNQLNLMTGISCIDVVAGGYRRKELNGILGFTGQNKSNIVRHMAYNIACANKKVLHVPLETDPNEEVSIYTVMHAHWNRIKLKEEDGEKRVEFASPLSFQDVAYGITRSTVDRVTMDDKSYEYFTKAVGPDLARTVGRSIRIRVPEQKTWSSFLELIDREYDEEPFDLLVVDYLTLLHNEESKDSVQGTNQMIKHMKDWTLNKGERGVCTVTPIQGNRGGYEVASVDGIWQVSGIHLYSEFDKSCDTIIGTWTSDEMKEKGEAKLSSPKLRRSSIGIKGDIIKFDPYCHMITRDGLGTAVNIVQDNQPQAANQVRNGILEGQDQVLIF